MEEKKEYKFSIKLGSERFYNEATYYGIIDFYTNDDIPHTNHSPFDGIGNKYGTLVGNMQKLEYGVDYNVVAEIVIDKKYGYQYRAKSVTSEIPKTIDQQQVFLKSIATEKQAKSLLSSYPNAVEMIMNNEEIDLSKVNGIKEKTFEKIRKKVMDNYVIQDILVLLMPLGVTYKTVVNMLDIENNAVLLKKKIIENPYILTKVRGLGFKKVDSIALKLSPELKVSRERTVAFLEYKLKEIASSSGDTWVSKTALTKEVSNNIYQCMEIYRELMEENENDPNLLFIDGKMIGLKKFFKTEENILKHLYYLNSCESIFEKPTNVEIESSIRQTESQQGFEFTDEQRKAIINSVDNNVIIITSPAGGGKTSVVKGIVNLLNQMKLTDKATEENMYKIDDEELENNRIVYGDEWIKNEELFSHYKSRSSVSQVALSACAAKRIKQVTSLDSATIHRTLGYDGGGFAHNKDFRLNLDINVIDEMSMVNIGLLWSYIQSIKHGSKLIMVFDFAQLPAIGAGDMARDILNSDLCINKFTKVHRQGQKSGILMDANKIRVGKNPIDELKPKITNGELKDMHYVFSNDVSKLESVAIKRFVSASSEIGIENVILTTPKKKNGKISCVHLNNKIQNIIIPDPDTKFIMQKKYGMDIKFKLGAKIINRENDYSRNVFNGDIGYIEDVDLNYKTFTVFFKDMNMRITYKFEEISAFDLAYCLSIHSMQGSQAHTVICVFDNSAYIMLNRKILYTALTRAEKRCLAVCQPKAFKACIDDANNRERRTWANEYFEGNIDFDLTTI